MAMIPRPGQRVSNPAETLPGDIVVTRVAQRYYVSRVQPEGQPFGHIAILSERADALTCACQLVTEPQRVFLNEDANSRTYIEIDCAELKQRDGVH